ncbi:MAG: CHAT domain-containing protein [Dermatophilaceae bacterium]
MEIQRYCADVRTVLALAVSDPNRAVVVAERLLARSGDPWVRSVAHQARGVVLRDRGRADLAVAALRAALRLAARTGDRDREADVRATLGVALAVAGRAAAGLGHLNAAVDLADDPVMRAKVLMRRGYVLTIVLARHAEAARDLSRALVGIRRAGDLVWEARTLNLRGIAELAQGRLATAKLLVTEAGEIFVREGQDLEAAQTVHNRGYIAALRGDLPRALALYRRAAETYAACGVGLDELVGDQCATLVGAGLVADAVDLVTGTLDDAVLHPARRAELMLTQAGAELALGRADAALASARAARSRFVRQRRQVWALHAELMTLRARHQRGPVTRALVDSAADVGSRLEHLGEREAPLAWLVAGRAAGALGLSSAPDLLDAAAAHRHHPAALVATTGWLARGLRREIDGTRRGVLIACGRGLDILEAHRATLGSAELRALSATHGEQLAALALRHAAESSPRTLLRWAERWRAGSVTPATVAPARSAGAARDGETVEVLAALRASERRLAAARAAGEPLPMLQRAHADLEQRVRRTSHLRAGDGSRPPRLDVDRLVAEVAAAGASLVELVEVGDQLSVLVVSGGTVRRFAVGGIQDAERAADLARFVLHQAARGRTVATGQVAGRLGAATLGRAVRALGQGPVVISPTSRLHAVPWAMVPELADRPVTVVPSAAAWLRCRAASASASASGTVLVVGPGLESGGAEVDVLAGRDPAARVLRDGSATVDGCLAALDGASVAHVAAHGRFRHDSPLFSAIQLDDGALTVHDLQRMQRAPHRLVLSACESGVMAPVGTRELLGLSSALLDLGTVGIVSSVVPVNDRASVPLMVELHAALDDLDELGPAMQRARRAVRDEPVLAATAAAYLAVGA